MNSLTVRFFFHQIAPKMRGDYMRFKALYMSQIPIPAATPADCSAIDRLVDKCLTARGENCGAWESEINDRVYRLYGLTKDEIKLVEDSAK